MTTITEREIYNSILDGTYDVDVLCGFATKKLAQLDKRNASAAKRAAAKRAAGDEITNGVYAFVTDEPQNRAQIAAAYNAAHGTELSDAKIGARLSKLTREGKIAKFETKDFGMTYTLPHAE